MIVWNDVNVDAVVVRHVAQVVDSRENFDLSDSRIDCNDCLYNSI